MRKLITVRDGGDEWISLRRRMLQAGCFPALILGAGIPILIVSVVALSRLPVSTNPSRIQSLIATGGVLLLVLNLAASEGLRIGAAVMGSRAGASTSSSLPERLRVIQRRLLPIETSLAVLRGLTYLLFGFVSLILALTYSRSIAPRSPAEWGAQLSFLVQRIEGILSVIGPEEAGFLALLIGVGAHSLVGPFLTVPYSAALGAAAGTRTGSNQRSVGLALSLRLGASLAGALTSLWGWALLLLAGMTITDAGNYPFVSSTLAAIILRLTDSVFIPIVVAIAALSFVALYALSQIVMARILARIATRQQVDQTQVPKRKERFAEILEAITPEEVAEGVGN